MCSKKKTKTQSYGSAAKTQASAGNHQPAGRVPDFVINKTKRADIERVMLELQMLEESLLAKNPLVMAGLCAPVPPTSASGTAIGSAQTLQQFRVFADQQKGTVLTPAFLQDQALARGLNPREAVSSVQQMQQHELRVQAEAIAYHMLPELRSLVYGQEVTERSLLDLVRRKVQGNLTVPAALVDPVAQIIVAQLKAESGVQ